ncbi:retrotransposon protein, putative, ty1-copia subclass [Tanacetum coccineum]
MIYSFYYLPENKVIVAQNAKFFENSLITQEASESLEDLEVIQEEDTHPSENTSLHHDDEQEIVDLKVMLFLFSDKWLNAMNVEMQSMKDNQVWDLVDLPPNGVDYEEIFSPTTNIRAIRILIAIVAYYDYEIWQIDVKTTFLNGHLNEELYMVQPEDFVNPKYPNQEIKKFSFTQNRDEPCVHVKSSGSNDLGEAGYIYGIKIYRDRPRKLIGLCQSAYTEKLLKRFNRENSKRGDIPMQEKLRLSKAQGASPDEAKRIQRVLYASVIEGGLHWTVSKNILKYLHNNKDMFRVYDGDIKRELGVTCYTDVGYLTNANYLKSQNGYVFILNGGGVG